MPVLKQEVVGAWVRRLRNERGLSLRTLATRARFSPSFISQVENGVVSPSISSMERIAAVLGVTMGEFFTTVATGSAALIVRSDERLQLLSQWSQARVEALSTSAGRRLDPLLVTIEPGGRSAKHPMACPTEEFAFVLAGNPTVALGPEEHTLSPGDAVTIRPQELRRWENRGHGVVRILVVAGR